MTRMIFVNLPVADLRRSMAFYEALGFTNNPQFTNEQAAAMMWSDAVYVMLLTMISGRPSRRRTFRTPGKARR